MALEAPNDFREPRPEFWTTAISVPAGCPQMGELQLRVNLVTGVAGYVTIAVEAADGLPAPPGGTFCGLAQANLLKGNAVAAVASWAPRGAADGSTASLAPWAGRLVSLRVEMVDAKLFSLRIVCVLPPPPAPGLRVLLGSG